MSLPVEEERLRGVVRFPCMRVLIVGGRGHDVGIVLRPWMRAGFAPQWEQVYTEEDYVAQLSADLDVILCDHQLTGWSAARALQLLREGEWKIPFFEVAITGGAEPDVTRPQHPTAGHLKNRSPSWGSTFQHWLQAPRRTRGRPAAETALRAGERMPGAAIDALAAQIAVVDKEGFIVAVNASWREFAERNGGGLAAVGEGANYLEICAKSGEIEAAAGIRDVLAGTRCEFTLEYPCHSGREERWFFMRVTLLPDDGPRRVVISHENVTERVRVEMARCQSEEKYRTVFANMSEGFCLIEMVFNSMGQPVDFCFLEVSASFEHQTGLSNAQGQFMRDLVPDLESDWYEIFGRVAQTGEAMRFVNEIKTLDRWYDVSAVRVGGEGSRKVAVFYDNITARQQVEAEMVANLRMQKLLADLSSRFFALPPERFGEAIEETQRVLVETLGADRCTLWERDERDDCFLLTRCWQAGDCPPLPKTESFQSLFPWISARLVSGEAVSFFDLSELPPEARRDVEVFQTCRTKSSVITPLLISGQVCGAMSFSTTRGHHRWSEFELAELRLVAQLVANVLGRWRAERREDVLQSDLAHAMRVASLGEMAAALAHELNQPLAAILSNAQAAHRFIATGELEPGELRAILSDIVRDDKRAGSIIQHLHAMANKRPSIRTACCLNELVLEVVELLHSKMVEAKVEVRLALAPELGSIHARRVELQQVMVNLFLNALHAMGEIALSLRFIEVETRSAGDSVVVSIRDGGPGIPPEMLGTIFDQFFSTKESGLGMGLSICRRIVENHGGSIAATNHLNGGALFTVTFPASRALS